MIESRNLNLKRKKNLLSDNFIDSKVYLCEILSYSVQEERLILRLTDGLLTELSLDAIYTAEFNSHTGPVLCEGVIKERYQCKEGSIIVLHIENGFYKVFTD